MTQATVTQTNTVLNQTDGSALYQVVFEVTASEGIALALFTYKTLDQTFHHPATIYDLETFPNNREDAITLGLDFYRSIEVTKTFEDIADALNFITAIKGRLQKITDEVNRAQASFAGTTTLVFDANE